MARPLEHVARMTSAGLEDVALAIAAEFSPVDFAVAHGRIDLLAEGLGRLGDDPRARGEALLQRLGEECGFDVAERSAPSGLLLDRVIEDRRGHPYMLAVLYAAVARRAGYQLCPAGNERLLILGDPSTTPPIAIDPVPGGRAPQPEMRWLCPHVVGTMVLSALGRSWLAQGSIEKAILAAELRLVLPIRRSAREQFERELLGLRARLN